MSRGSSANLFAQSKSPYKNLRPKSDLQNQLRLEVQRQNRKLYHVLLLLSTSFSFDWEASETYRWKYSCHLFFLKYIYRWEEKLKAKESLPRGFIYIEGFWRDEEAFRRQRMCAVFKIDQNRWDSGNGIVTDKGSRRTRRE